MLGVSRRNVLSARRALSLAGLALLVFHPTTLMGTEASAKEARLPVRDASHALTSDLPTPGTVAFLGVVTARHRRGLEVARVVRGSASERAGLRRGDVLRSLDERTLASPVDLDRALAARGPGARVSMTLVRDGTLVDRRIVLGGRRPATRVFRGGLFRLAVVPVLFADDTVDAAVRDSAAKRFFFETRGRTGAGASVAEYFAAQSLGSLRVDGRVLAPIRLPRPRSAYGARPMGAGKGSLFAAAAQRLEERDGAVALRDVDGLVFLHTGVSESRPGRALWPHRATVSVAGRRLPYYVHSGETVAAGEIGEHCHEFAHLLGLSDEYGVGHRTGSGDFCVMAIGHRGGGRDGAASPFSLCAPCRVRLGWLPIVVVDPRVVQRLRLVPGNRRGARAVVVPLDTRTHEYLLLEVRARQGFDTDIPSAGLLVWHVGGEATPGQGRYGNDVDLIEAHGIDTFDAALVRTGEIAFPTRRVRDLTPDTVPSSASQRSGAFGAYLTDMEREADGSVIVTIGARPVVRQAPPTLAADEVPDPGIVERIDPVTGEIVMFDVIRTVVPDASEHPDSR